VICKSILVVGFKNSKSTTAIADESREYSKKGRKQGNNNARKEERENKEKQ
jgi:hypothetical protein